MERVNPPRSRRQERAPAEPGRLPLLPAPPPYRMPADPGALLAAAFAEPAVPEQPPSPPPARPGPLRHPPEVYRELEAIYRGVDRAIAALGPRCERRGLCCDFDRVDHVLYASQLEIDYVRDHVPPARYLLPSGNACPFLHQGQCTARAVRMLGCRTYFCQQGWEALGAEIYERALGRLKALAARHGLGWRYAPALELLREESS
ncbi:MAG: hypothetical protein KatS3mg102_1750 [Planctomycetota bacterium]|nr:MAG: hypothetical protein KatS3mg102_1750 [Planctomycetota bacterium]